MWSWRPEYARWSQSISIGVRSRLRALSQQFWAQRRRKLHGVMSNWYLQAIQIIWSQLMKPLCTRTNVSITINKVIWRQYWKLALSINLWRHLSKSFPSLSKRASWFWSAILQHIMSKCCLCCKIMKLWCSGPRTRWMLWACQKWRVRCAIKFNSAEICKQRACLCLKL